MISLSDKQISDLAQRARVMQIIVGMLVVGATFAGLLLTIVVPREKMHWDFSMEHFIGAMAVGFMALMILVWLVSPFFLHKSIVIKAATPDDDEVLQAHAQVQTEAIIRGAMLEGAVFFCWMAWLVDGSLLAVVSGIVGLALLATMIPTLNAQVRSIENHLSRN